MDAPILSAQQISAPEGLIGVTEMIALVATITMHTVRIYHEIKFLSGSLESIHQKKSILMMYIIITSTMRDLQHYRLYRCPIRTDTVAYERPWQLCGFDFCKCFIRRYCC